MHKNSLDAVLSRMMDFLGVKTDSSLSRALSVNRQTLAGWRKRDSVPYVECIKFCEEHSICLDWLLAGEGPMRRDGATPSVDSATDGPHERSFLALWRELDDAAQQEVRRVAEDKKRLATLEQRLTELEAVVAAGKRLA